MQPKDNIYEQYAYSYPHKQAYRELLTPISLQTAWSKEDKTRLSAYLHLPFCEMRCGFCNLFTVSNPKNGIDTYLDALQREAQTYHTSLPSIQFETYAIGGGTPTFLEADDFAKMLSIFRDDLGVDTNQKYGSIEASPKSISPEKIALIESYGINRVSIGIQSWIEQETKLLGRPQTPELAHQALSQLSNSTIPEINIDLIYGIHGQTKKSWLYSLQKTLEFDPVEVYLYPLYTRALTGLEKMNHQQEDHRLMLYRIGRDFLKNEGYEQVSMRCFRKSKIGHVETLHNSVVDGMIGIGAGARSYTKTLHYSTHYAVSRKAIQSIIETYSTKQSADFEQITYGIYLDEAERIRRFLIKSLIDGGSLDSELFEQYFNQKIESISIIMDLFEQGWLMQNGSIIRLNEAGMEMEDFIGPALFSDQILNLMSEYELQ